MIASSTLEDSTYRILPEFDASYFTIARIASFAVELVFDVSWWPADRLSHVMMPMFIADYAPILLIKSECSS